MVARRVLVCGGRDYEDGRRVFEALNEVVENGGISLLVTGYDPTRPRGADMLAYQWALTHGVDQCCFPPNWKARGKPGGPYRNGLMLEYIRPSLVLAFPGGNGTADMVKRARKAGLDVWEITA